MGENVRIVRVERMTRLAEDVVEVLLVDPSGADLPAWEPGAHIAPRLPNGVSRQYSLCGADGGTWTIAVHRSPSSRGASSYVHDQLRVASTLTVEGPVNHFALEPAARHLMVAGGIGVTPILSMVRRLRATPAADFEFVYCGRSRAVMAYLDEIAGWQDPRVVVHADDERGGPIDLAALLAERPRTLVYCCGPEAMIDAVECSAPDPRLVRVERFRAAPPAAGTTDSGFDLVLAGGEERLRVEANESILEVLERAGINVPASCREGICGTCETKVLAGEPDHRDSILTPAEKAENCSMMVCVSRAKSAELVLGFS